jgi:integrase/recombinase XerD
VFDRIKRRLSPLTLTRALAIVRRVAARNREETDKFDRPIALLIAYLGEDAKVTDITPEQLTNWFNHVKGLENQRKPGQKLSLWTVNSYGRLIRAFFNHLVKMGHLEKTPWKATIGRLPKLHRKDIPQSDIDLMVKYVGLNLRDRAIVLILRDSGCRAGELLSMTLNNIHFDKKPDKKGKKRLCGYALVYGQKMRKHRHILFKEEAAKALKAYLDARPPVEFDSVWLAYDNRPLTVSGVYQLLRRIGRVAGVTRFNAHSFRHARTKELYRAGVPEPVIRELMGHDGMDVTRLYVQYEAGELLDMLYTLPDENGQIEQSPKKSKKKNRPAS